MSGSADRTLRTWTSRSQSVDDFKCVEVLRAHRGSVDCIGVHPSQNLYASGSVDASVQLWTIESENGISKSTPIQNIRLAPKFYPLALAFGAPGLNGSYILAVSGTTNVIYLYTSGALGAPTMFVFATSLHGHEGWIQSLDFTQEGEVATGGLLLASASQDKSIRIWRISRCHDESRSGSRIQSVLPEGLDSGFIASRCTQFRAASLCYSASFEALLLGHEDWVTSASWDATCRSRRLLSASADNSVAIWEPDPGSGTWACSTRLGEISTQKGSTTATGSFGGLWLALWGPRGDSLTALGRTGGWRLWTFYRNKGEWIQETCISGHSKTVSGIAWAKDGSCLFSTSSDQTTRLHGPFRHGGHVSWHECSRAQIHGYDLNCIDTLKGGSIVTGADEKLLRAFTKPRATAMLLASMVEGKVVALESLPPVAAVPTLALSNKMAENIVENDGPSRTEEALSVVTHASEDHDRSLEVTRLPTEDYLARHTRWRAMAKLYGHGYEISAIATSHKGDLIASACKSSSVEYAVIRLYETRKWREVKPSLVAHSLTVNCLRFSEDDEFLISAGRDRQHAVFRRRTASDVIYELVALEPKSHSRMVLSAAWAPVYEKRTFATAGRDRLIKVWQLSENRSECRSQISSTDPVRSIEFAPLVRRRMSVLVYGTESGNVSICGIDIFKFSTVWTKLIKPR